ncbi:unnamed protein product, partial [Brassica rapa subsp. trilocularis]
VHPPFLRVDIPVLIERAYYLLHRRRHKNLSFVLFLDL